MVDIVIGAVQPMSPPTGKKDTSARMVEAELLHVRQPRKKISRPREKERRRRFRQDPPNGRVLTILVPDGMLLPRDLDPRYYKVLLRLIKK